MKRGCFITIEGTDGSGKSTQIRLMEAYLKEKGYDVVVTRDPGGNDISEKIRNVILDPQNTKMARETEFLLYCAARAQLVAEIVKPAIESGKVVICDRFIDSTYVYQGFGRGISIDNIEILNNITLNGSYPDMTFFLDLSPEVALNRRLNATGADRIENEKMEFHMNVYNGYKKLADIFSDRIRVIDASRPIEKVFEDIKKELESKV